LFRKFFRKPGRSGFCCPKAAFIDGLSGSIRAPFGFVAGNNYDVRLNEATP